MWTDGRSDGRQSRVSREALAQTLERYRQRGETDSDTPFDSQRWHQADQVFAEALGVPEVERAAFLEQACASDLVLRELVEELLSFDDELGSVSEGPALDAVRHAASFASREERIGPYSLIRQLGTGGMGTVYLAEQSEPVERNVALKLIKAGLDSDQVLARFEGERQALALMEHANVAQVFDAGSTEAGRSYFAMEYVPGHEITEHCDREALNFRDRVRLFLQVCDGVQHAHQKGLIHRDLKPSNILVKTAFDEPATVKIIDFGVAKSMERKLSAQAARTQLGTFVGTLVYSSPEQVLGKVLETDTRSDIYSLGIVLYELLVGIPPHTLAEFEGRTQAEIVRMISEEPPSAPIERFSTSSEDAETVAERRSLSVEAMQRRLRGDVSWILLKCLEPRPEDRYPSVSELRKDLERWLEGLPLEARPSTGLYRLQKLVRRHRTAVAATTLVALALLATAAAAVTGFLRAEQAAAEAELAANFQVEQLQEIDPAAMGLGLRSQLIEAVGKRLTDRGGEPDAVEAEVAALERLLRNANFTDLSLSLLDEHLFERAEAAIGEKYGEAPLLQARLWQSVANTRRALGQSEGAEEPQERALEIRRRELGPEHELALESLASRGHLRLGLGRFEEAEVDFREAAQGQRRVLGDEHLSTLGSINGLGVLLQAREEFDEAEPYLRESLGSLRRVLGNQHPNTLDAINNLGALLHAQGKLDEAEPYYRESLETRRQVLGNQHPETLISINNMGGLLRTQGKVDASEPYHREALETRRQVLGDFHPHTMASVWNLGGLLRKQGKLEEAEPYYREALDAYRRIFGDDHLDSLYAARNLARLLNERSKHSESVEVLEGTLPIAETTLGQGHQLTAEMRSLAGEGLVGLGAYERAEVSLLESYEVLEATLEGGRRLQKLQKAAERLAGLYEAWGKAAPAAEWRSTAEALDPTAGAPDRSLTNDP